MTIMPNTRYGKWAVSLFALAVVLFISANLLFQEPQTGTEETGLNLPVVPGFIAGFVAVALALYSIFKERERALVVIAIPVIMLVLVILGSLPS